MIYLPCVYYLLDLFHELSDTQKQLLNRLFLYEGKVNLDSGKLHCSVEKVLEIWVLVPSGCEYLNGVISSGVMQKK